MIANCDSGWVSLSSIWIRVYLSAIKWVNISTVFEFLEIPRITHPVTANINYSQESPVNVSCIATGTPESDVVWISIRSTQVMSSGLKKAFLVFSSISKADSGMYICRANNSAGSSEKTFELTAKCEYITEWNVKLYQSTWAFSGIRHAILFPCWRAFYEIYVFVVLAQGLSFFLYLTNVL